MNGVIFQETVPKGREVRQVRQKARQAAEALGLDPSAQTRVATAVSEAARAAAALADTHLTLEVAGDELCVRIDADKGLLRTDSGEGASGLTAARRLMDRDQVEAAAEGRVRVSLFRKLPPEGRARVAEVKTALTQSTVDPRAEADQAMADLAAVLGELNARQGDLERVSRELEETNRGVVALYAELDEKAEQLRRVSDVKSRFISNVSHEFRTPINSILSLTRILLDEVDGQLNGEQQKQVHFVRKSAESLSELVNDLLDLSKIEAGKVDVRPVQFEAAEFLSALRGVMRPLLTNEKVALVVEPAEGVGTLLTDEGKLSQIVRNLVSNALKFTEHGEVRVRMEEEVPGVLHVAVSDTGIGISKEHQEKIFEEFVQVEGPHQRRVKGTGLGLPLSRRLAELLGGTLTLQSAPGVGSTFHVRIPKVYGERPKEAAPTAPVELPKMDAQRQPVLVVEDDAQTLFVYEKFLRDSGFQVVPARNLQEARALVGQFKPAAVVLDVLLEGETSWGFLAELRGSEKTRDVPVLVATVIDHQQKARALGADEFCIKPVERNWLLSRLARLSQRGNARRVLVVDDDDVSRYLVRRALEDTPWEVVEATGGKEGLQRATSHTPDLILLDLAMPDMNGFDVLDALKADARTQAIPVIIHSGRQLTSEERERLSHGAEGFLEKTEQPRQEALTRIREALLNAGVRPQH